LGKPLSPNYGGREDAEAFFSVKKQCRRTVKTALVVNSQNPKPREFNLGKS